MLHHSYLVSSSLFLSHRLLAQTGNSISFTGMHEECKEGECLLIFDGKSFTIEKVGRECE